MDEIEVILCWLVECRTPEGWPDLGKEPFALCVVLESVKSRQD